MEVDGIVMSNSRLTSGLEAFESKLRGRGYHELSPFFVLREGKIYDERTGDFVHLNRERLERIAETQNRRIADSEDATPIVIGHTKRGKDEQQQPELVGYASRWEVVPFKNTRTYGLQTVPWSRPGRVEEFEKYPRRSAEFWTDPDLIDPISILGANTPRLDLGLHQLQRDPVGSSYLPRKPIYLEMEQIMGEENKGGNGGTDSPATPANKAAAAGDESPVIKQMQAQLSQLMEMFQVLAPLIEEIKASQAQPGGGDPMGGGGGGAPMGGALAGPGGPAPVPQQLDMSGGCAGGTNSMMPQQMGRQQQQFVPGFPQMQQPMQLQQQFVPGMPQQYPQQYQPMQTADPRDQELATMRHQLASMQLAMVTQTTNALLDQLEPEIVVDRKRDFDRLVRLSRQEQDAEVAFMRNTRQKKDKPLPVEGVPLHMQAGHATGPHAAAGGGPMQLSLQQAMEAGYGTGPDPAIARAGNGQRDWYDSLTEAVRTRGRGEDPMVAYRRVMGGQVDPTTGKTIVPTRG